MMEPFAYAEGTTIEEVIAALGGTCRPLAGGTDLLPLMKKGLARPKRLVNLKTLPGLDTLRRGEDGWRIGALVTLARLARDEEMGQELAVLAGAALESASPQLRHRATLGGNLLQRPRCWYFREPLVPCWLKGGDRCFALEGDNRRHAVFGDGPCYMVHPSDPAVALLALEASVLALTPKGLWTIPVESFYREPRQDAWSESVLDPRTLILAVTIPAPAPGARGAYAKVAERAVWDFSLASAAVQLALVGDTVVAARVALGGVAPAPWRAREAEVALLGQGLTAATIDHAADAATAGAEPLSGNAYKVDLVRGVVAEALRRVGRGG
ncbi:MAG: FAD binding domain-containing protein [Anaerolineae bacterium]|jgi:xanthine dehydrogenase YagS FAD-binding subunit